MFRILFSLKLKRAPTGRWYEGAMFYDESYEVCICVSVFDEFTLDYISIKDQR